MYCNITDKLVVRESQPESEDDGADEPDGDRSGQGGESHFVRDKISCRNVSSEGVLLQLLDWQVNVE